MLKAIKGPNQTYLSKTISVAVSAGVLKSVLSAISLISLVIELSLRFRIRVGLELGQGWVRFTRSRLVRVRFVSIHLFRKM